MGLESISKASAAQYSAPAAAPAVQSVQAAGVSTAVSDDKAAQSAAVSVTGQEKSAAENAESKVTLADVKDISKVLNENTVAEFGVYEPMNRITITIKDKETGEVLKEIPSEKMLKMFTKACELAGLLVDEKR